MIGDEAAEKMTHYSFHAGERLTEANIRALCRAIAKKGHQSMDKLNPGEVPMKRLSAKDSVLQCMEVSDKEIQGFNGYAKRYGLSFSLAREKNDPTHYILSFRQQDISKLLAAAKDLLKDGMGHGDLEKKIEQARHTALTVNKVRQKLRAPKYKGRGKPSL